MIEYFLYCCLMFIFQLAVQKIGMEERDWSMKLVNVALVRLKSMMECSELATLSSLTIVISFFKSFCLICDK